MKTGKTEQMIEKLKNGETIICPKCGKGIIIYKPPMKGKFPEIYCNNIECNAKVIFN